MLKHPQGKNYFSFVAEYFLKKKEIYLILHVSVCEELYTDIRGVIKMSTLHHTSLVDM